MQLEGGFLEEVETFTTAFVRSRFKASEDFNGKLWTEVEFDFEGPQPRRARKSSRELSAVDTGESRGRLSARPSISLHTRMPKDQSGNGCVYQR